MSNSDQFDQIKERIKLGIKNKQIDFKNINKLIASHSFTYLDIFQEVRQRFKNIQDRKNVKHYGEIFSVVANYFKSIKDERIKELDFLLTKEFIREILDDLVEKFVLEKLCVECKSGNVVKIANPFDESKIAYFCNDCQKRVQIYQNVRHLSIFLLYLEKWITDEENNEEKEQYIHPRDYYREFLIYLILDSFEFFRNKGFLNTLLLFYKIINKNELKNERIPNTSQFKGILIENLKLSLTRQDFFDFISGKNYYNNLFGELPKEIHSQIIDTIVLSLRSGEVVKIKHAIEKLTHNNVQDLLSFPSNSKMKKKIENNFYVGLSKCLESKKFENFEKLIDFSIKFDIFIDVSKIPDRFKIISKLHLDCIQNVSIGYQTSSLGEVIEILRFCNKFNLVKRDLNEHELEKIKKIRQDELLMANLKDLFGLNISDSFIHYISEIMPHDLYDFFVNEPYMYYADSDQIINYIKHVFFNQYSIYGLSVRYLSSIEQFIREFKKNYLEFKTQAFEQDQELRLMEFKILYKYRTYFFNVEEERENFTIKKHLISPKNIFKNMNKILAKNNYNFYSLSMVLLGGLGPQGHGFTYSTPKGEVVEICSDIKENEAIIIKYKEFLKRQFLSELNKELRKFKIDDKNISKIIIFLEGVLKGNELINYTKKVQILRKIRSYVNEIKDSTDKITNFRSFIDKISEAMNNILREIKMEDQFRARMDLIDKDLLKSEDIAKLTSLREKSHFDVLRERFFFQYIVDWFYKIYTSQKKI
ncbi:MAG: hypothetical protein EU539_02900 [Promethearchaeota archaeon]|nr:MAG: hypothetical protein EU539_02900 [Candidatus Lokiarchaeota archaeon]